LPPDQPVTRSFDFANSTMSTLSNSAMGTTTASAKASCYQRTICAVTAEESAARCRAATVERQLAGGTSVRLAGEAIPLDVVSRLKAEATEEVRRTREAAAAAAVAADAAARAAADVRVGPAAASLEAVLAASDGGQRKGADHACVREFFQGGSLEGPFPGSRSVNGEWMAATYFAHVQHANGSRFAVGKHQPYAPAGYKLH
jgi:hypothetical protein